MGIHQGGGVTVNGVQCYKVKSETHFVTTAVVLCNVPSEEINRSTRDIAHIVFKLLSSIKECALKPVYTKHQLLIWRVSVIACIISDQLMIQCIFEVIHLVY